MEFIMLESIDQLTEEMLEALIKKHSMEEVPRFKKLKNYYLGKHDILNRKMADENKPNNKIVNPYASYITDMIQSYFIGKPIIYTSKNENFLEVMRNVYDTNDEQTHNSLIAKDMSIYGVAYELLYINEHNEIKFAQLPVEEVIMIYDTAIEPKPIGAIRYYQVMDYITGKGNMRVEVYTESTVQYYKQGKNHLEFIDERVHYFGQVPVNPYYNNDEEMGDYEKVIPLIDAYDKAISDSVNEHDYFADAYLIITGMQDTDPEEFAHMKENKIMLLGDGGKAEWLVKQSDTTGSEAYKNRLQSDIHKFSNVPDMSDDVLGNLSGIAIRYKFEGLDQITAIKERMFKMSLTNRVRMITNILNIKGNKFDANELTPIFTRNKLEDITEDVKLVKELYGIVSHQTLLTQLPFIDDVSDELHKLEMEKGAKAPDLNYEFPEVNCTLEDNEE